MEDSLNLRGAIELSKGKGKAICVAKGKKLMLDGDLEKTVTFLREKNVGVMIRDERELNQIRTHGEKAKEKPICGGKENAAPKVAPNDNVRSKAQCLRCERERVGECIQPRRPTFFPSLTPSRHRRACLEDGMSIEIPTNAPKRAKVSHAFQTSSVVAPNDNVRSKAQCLQRERERARDCIQPRQPTSFLSLTPSRRRRACLEDGMTSTSIEIPTNSPKRAMVSHAFELSSIVVLPKTPNLMDYSTTTRTPITVDSMLCHHEPQACQHSIPHIEESVAIPSIAMDEPKMCHRSMPPRNLEEEFLAVVTAHAELLDKELLAMLDTSSAPIHWQQGAQK